MRKTRKPAIGTGRPSNETCEKLGGHRKNICNPQNDFWQIKYLARRYHVSLNRARLIADLQGYRRAA